jgi:hypothetical protein
MTRTTMADQFAIDVANQAGGLDPDALACLRDEYAAWSPEQHNALASALSVPGTSTPAIQGRLDQLLSRCRVDRGHLRVP